MQKPIRVFLLFAVLALALAACGELTPPEAPTSVPQPATEAATAAAEPVAAPTTAAVAAPTSAVGPPAPAACRVDASSKSDPAQADQFPKVGTTDWSVGPENAFVTIIEYSDFQ